MNEFLKIKFQVSKIIKFLFKTFVKLFIFEAKYPML